MKELREIKDSQIVKSNVKPQEGRPEEFEVHLAKDIKVNNNILLTTAETQSLPESQNSH